jgi:hypothetical protein
MSRVGGLFIAGVTLCALGLSVSVVSAQNDRAPDEMFTVRGIYYPDSVVADVQKSPACPDEICPGLGNGFFLPETNVGEVTKPGNTVFLDRKLGRCVTLSSAPIERHIFQSAESMEQFTTSAMTEANLSGGLSTRKLTVKATTEALTGSSTSITTAFHSTHMDIASGFQTANFNQDADCFFSGKNLDKRFLQDFEALPLIDPKQVSEAAQWSAYVKFLTSYGSHVMMQQLIGSLFQQWESATSSEKDISKLLKAKACAEVEGTKAGGGWSVESCASYSKEEKEQALKLSTHHLRLVLGGSADARKAVSQKLDPDTLKAFITSAPKSTGAVQFMFRPIWQILDRIYTIPCSKEGKDSRACQNLQRAVNLQAAFEGWMAVRCQREEAMGVTYQKMAIDSTDSQGISTYKCTVTKTGCLVKNDCHFGGFFVCYCYGAGCIDRGDQVDTNTYRDEIRLKEKGSYTEGVNNSCYRKSLTCNCDADWSGGLSDRNIYQQSALRLLRLIGH